MYRRNLCAGWLREFHMDVWKQEILLHVRNTAVRRQEHLRTAHSDREDRRENTQETQR